MTSAVDDRLISLEAVHNFRDLGGYETGDGRVLRERLLFRADALSRLTAADIETLRPLRLRTVIDLRTDGEISERGAFPRDRYTVRWHHLPLIDVTWSHADAEGVDPVEFLYSEYRSMLAYGEPRYAEGFQILALPGALPAVFHCAAGKDRTGVLAALLLGALGVPDDVIVADYALTRAAMVRTRAWAEVHNPEMIARMRSMPAALTTAQPEAMARLLTDIVRDHGTIYDYVRNVGVARATLDALADALLIDADQRAA